MTKYILWNPDLEILGPNDPDYICEIEFAKQFNISLIENPDEIFTFAWPSYLVGEDPRKKIVLRHWRNWEGIDTPKDDYSWADLLILYTNDVAIGPWESYCSAVEEQFNCKKFICISEGLYDLHDYPQDRVYIDHEHHSNRIVNFCHYEDWNVFEDKPMLFDALIGSIDEDIKPHRHFLFKQLKKHDLLDRSFVNVWGSINYRSPELKEYDDPAIVNFRNSTVYANNFKNGRSMSNSIPTEVYKRSWYSIVAETHAEKSSHLTEKTSKALFEKRLFVIFGSQGLLSRLHKLGYQTFSDVIDERYDDEPDNVKRWTMAFEQVLTLANADHQAIYDKIAPTLEHNHQWMVGRQLERLQGLKNFLDRHIDKL